MSEQQHTDSRTQVADASHELQTLREILLRDERKKIETLQQILEERNLLSQRVSPIVQEHLQFMKDNFPAEFKVAVEDIFDQRIKASQEDLLNVIYPTLGAMIRKYIAHSIQQLRESIEKQVRQTLDWNLVKRRFKAWWTGIPEADILLADSQKPTLQEVHIIETHSGILLGSASLTPTLDREAVAGMLTAIKAFAEDAFQREHAQLDGIQYGEYQLIIKQVYSYYVAMAVSGSLTQSDRDHFEELLLQFTTTEAKTLTKATHQDMKEQVSALLYHFFFVDHTTKT